MPASSPRVVEGTGSRGGEPGRMSLGNLAKAFSCCGVSVHAHTQGCSCRGRESSVCIATNVGVLHAVGLVTVEPSRADVLARFSVRRPSERSPARAWLSTITSNPAPSKAIPSFQISLPQAPHLDPQTPRPCSPNRDPCTRAFSSQPSTTTRSSWFKYCPDQSPCWNRIARARPTAGSGDAALHPDL